MTPFYLNSRFSVQMQLWTIRKSKLNESNVRRTNNTTPRTSQYTAHSETVQLNYMHRVQHKKHTEHQMTTQDKIYRVHTRTTRSGTKETEIGSENQDKTPNAMTQSIYTFNITYTTVHDDNTFEHVQESVGGKHPTQVTNHLLTLNTDGNRLSQSQSRPENAKNKKYCTHTFKREISNTAHIQKENTHIKTSFSHNLMNTSTRHKIIPQRVIHSHTNMFITPKNISEYSSTTCHRHNNGNQDHNRGLLRSQEQRLGEEHVTHQTSDVTTITAQTHIQLTHNTVSYKDRNTATETYTNLTWSKQKITTHQENTPSLNATEPAIRKTKPSEIGKHETNDNNGMVRHRENNPKAISIGSITTTNQMGLSASINPQIGTRKFRQEFSLSISATDGKMRLAKIIKSQSANGKQIRPNHNYRPPQTPRQHVRLFQLKKRLIEKAQRLPLTVCFQNCLHL